MFLDISLSIYNDVIVTLINGTWKEHVWLSLRIIISVPANVMYSIISASVIDFQKSGAPFTNMV